MKSAAPNTPEKLHKDNGKGRNQLEIIRFANPDDERRAIQALLDAGMLNLSSTREDRWSVYTPVALKLRELGVPFEWLTEHV